MSSKKFQFKGKIKKRDFETKLFDIFGDNRDISSRVYVEEGKRLTLYYVENGHAGTWQSGEAWIFTSIDVEKHIRDLKALTKH
jgi:hypothetical protein